MGDAVSLGARSASPCHPHTPPPAGPLARAQVITAALRGDPWETLGVTQDADEKEIKRAHRRLVLRLHPDVRKARQGGAGDEDAQAEAAFLAVQEAYEIIMGRRRGKELDASADGNSWEFHDWWVGGAGWGRGGCADGRRGWWGYSVVPGMVGRLATCIWFTSMLS